MGVYKIPKAIKPTWKEGVLTPKASEKMGKPTKRDSSQSMNPVVIVEANKLKISFYDHFTHIIIHSLLHTNNYRHNSKKNFQKMKKIETLLLKKLNIDNPYK